MSLVLAVLPVCEAWATGPFQIELKLKLRMSIEIGTCTTPARALYTWRVYIAPELILKRGSSLHANKHVFTRRPLLLLMGTLQLLLLNLILNGACERPPALVHKQHGVCCSQKRASECRRLGFNPGRRLPPRGPKLPAATAVNCTLVRQARQSPQHSPPHLPQVLSPLANAHVYFTGCGRNLGAVLDSTAAHITALGSHFVGYDVVVFEDGSTDGTRTMLQQWVARDSHVSLLLANGVKAAGSRTMRLALCRNTLLRTSIALSGGGASPSSGLSPRSPGYESSGVSHVMVMLDLDCPHGTSLTPAALGAAVVAMHVPLSTHPRRLKGVVSPYPSAQSGNEVLLALLQTLHQTALL